MTTVRSLRRSKRGAFVLLAALAVAFGTRVSAHRLDEFLQAARIAIEPDRVELELSLTPGTAVADDVIRAIDADANGVLSQAEQLAYADRVLSALTLSVDDAIPLRMDLRAATFPDLEALRSGDGAITIRLHATLAHPPVGRHRLVFRNQHAPANSVYLANALVPESDGVAVTGQQRDGDQRELTIDFAIGEAPPASGSRWLWAGLVSALALALGSRRWPNRSFREAIIAGNRSK